MKKLERAVKTYVFQCKIIFQRRYVKTDAIFFEAEVYESVNQEYFESYKLNK